MPAAGPASGTTRPTALLPWRQLGLISVYWLGINAVWGGYEWFGQARAALLAIGVLEFSLAALTFRFVDHGPRGQPRHGRSWLSIAKEAWGMDVLRERSFLRMTVVRFLFLMGMGFFLNLSRWYLHDSLGQTDEADQTFWGVVSLGSLALATLVSAIPAARISDRVGRKPVIWAACFIAAAGIAVISWAPTPPVAVAGLFLMGIGSGAYLAVDWALMTETIPLVTSGRYMGLANIANSMATPVGLLIAGPLVIDTLTRAGMIGMGPRAAVALGIPALAVAAVVLIGVHPRRDPRQPEVGPPA